VKLSRAEEALITRKRRQAAARASRKAERRTRPGRQRDPGFLAFLRRLPCVAGMVEAGCSGPIEAAHIRFSDARAGRINPGMQAKPDDRWATPLCRHHHQHDQHAGSERAFWERLGVDPGALSTELFHAYLAGRDGRAVLRDYVGARRAA